MPPERRGNMALPLFHLRSSHFWHLIAKPGKEVEFENIREINSLKQLSQLIFGAKLDENLYNLLLDLCSATYFGLH
jgi:putative restriction endonuclease